MNVLRQQIEDLENNQLTETPTIATSYHFVDSAKAKFREFLPEGHSEQDGEPSPENEVPILSAGDNGSITEKIFNKNLANKAGNGYIANDGGITATNVAFYTSFLPIPENVTHVYYYGSNLSSSMTNVYTNRIGFYDENKEKILVNGSISASTAYQLPTETKYIRASFLNAVEDYMLAFGTATDYVPHEEQTKTYYTQQPFRSVGDVRDKFNENNKTEDHYIARKIFDGTEDWTRGQVGDIYRFSTTLSDILAINARNIVLSNYFKYNGDVSVNTHGLIFASNKNLFIYPDENITTVSELKAWITEKYANGTPLYVDYKSEEPQVLPCTPEQIQQLENRPSTYKTETNVISEDEVEAYIDAEYVIDLKTYIDNN